MTFQSRDKVKITCKVNGFPVPSILWYKDDALMEFDKRIIVVESSLVIRDAQMSDAGEYECNALNIAGQSQLKSQLDCQILTRLAAKTCYIICSLFKK